MLGMDLTRPAVQKYFSSPDHHTFFSSRVFSRKTRALNGAFLPGFRIAQQSYRAWDGIGSHTGLRLQRELAEGGEEAGMGVSE
jgi:hypothetical protein